MQVLLQALLATVLFVLPLWKICKRAGFHPALSLIAVVPLVGILIVGAILAFAEWPAARRRAAVASTVVEV